MEYDMLNFDIALKEKVETNGNKKESIEIDITPETYLESIAEEDLQKSYEFYEKINEYHAKAIREAYNYVVFR